MEIADYIIIFIYFAGLLRLGSVLGKRIKSSKDLFIAGKNSSWWLSGLSTYMTIFSAGTFVVWGGVAYRSGLVAAIIGMVLGVSSILVGLFLAGKWSKQGIDSPAEYLGVRFNKSIVRFYTIVGIIGRGVHMAVGLYAIAIMVVAVIPLPEGHFFVDPATGHLSVAYPILLLGVITLIYTAAGGFIAVLMTDLVQFAVLLAMILIMVPLSFESVGGVSSFISNAPDGYFALFSDQYSWGWMVLWVFLNFFMIGGDWGFVQRYISVPTAKDAKKSAYFVGILYLLTPILWYIPAMAYRIINPNANPEQAFMLISQHVLGVGMLGMMLAAMISATLSMVSSTLNVFANVFTYDIYRAFRPNTSDKSLMTIGRLFTYIYGLSITVMALMIPYFGGAEKVVVPILTLVISPLFIPSIWGLFSKRIGVKAIWWSMGITYFIAFVIKAGLFDDIVSDHVEFVDAFIGFVTPFSILLIIELVSWKKSKDAGWIRFVALTRQSEVRDEQSRKEESKQAGSMYSSMAIKLLIGTFAAIGVIMGLLAFEESNDRGQMLMYASIFLAVSISGLLLFYFNKSKFKTN